ncbi:MAG: carboxypeptidase-like regulatory domain-containing protein [Crocinitomicaceae bacterium]|nr:carboxypeptidase-like regulatory domain-containing protein [Crocinitomicaceae bacterium]
MPSISKHIFLLLLLSGALLQTFAQKTIVSGKVLDGDSKEPVMYAPVFFVGTKTGTTTDDNGNFRIETYYSSDSLRCQSVGYTPMTKKIKQGTTMTIDFVLTPSTTLETVIIKPKEGPNPAIEMVKNILRNKKINNREKLDAYEYEAYNKVEFDLNNITEEFQKRKIFKPFEFIFEGVDTTQEKPYLPVFMTESLSDFYFRRTPKTAKEIIEATKVSGVENQSINQFLGDMYQNVNIYDNEIVMFNKSFTSPISTYCLGFYDYGLIDSAWIDNKWCYLLQFFPRRKSELLFFGEMWVNDSTYAIKSVEATIAEGANINWIKSFSVKQEYNEVENEVWMLTGDQLLIDFNPTKNRMGVYGRKTSSYKNFVINKPREDEVYKGVSDVLVNEDASSKGDEFWQQARHIELSANEERIYHMVDTLKSLPQFRTVENIITLFVSGYKVIGNFEFGPYYTLYSFNPIEGNRVRIGGRTSNEFSKRVMLEGYLAYGLRDERFKYGGGITYIMKKNPRMALGGYAKRDMEQLGQGTGAFRQDNVLSSLFRRNPANKLTDVTQAEGYFEREWLYGFSNKLIFTHRVLKPAGDKYTYTRVEDHKYRNQVNFLITSEVTLYTRFAYKEKFVYGEFERVSLGTTYPELEASYSVAIPGLLDAQFRYQKAVIQVKDKLRFGPFGYINFTGQAGKIFGLLPYPMLMMHQGNETFFYDEGSYNTMNFFEFVSDEWVSIWASYHAEGLFLNKIPLMRRLKWREVASAKGVVGGYNRANDDILSRDFNGDGKPDMFTLERPYVEAALGVENIFKILRIDFIWRLSYLDHPDIVKYGLRAKLQVDF